MKINDMNLKAQLAQIINNHLMHLFVMNLMNLLVMIWEQSNGQSSDSDDLVELVGIDNSYVYLGALQPSADEESEIENKASQARNHSQ